MSDLKRHITQNWLDLGYMLLHKSYINMAIPDRVVTKMNAKTDRKSLKGDFRLRPAKITGKSQARLCNQ